MDLAMSYDSCTNIDIFNVMIFSPSNSVKMTSHLVSKTGFCVPREGPRNKSYTIEQIKDRPSIQSYLICHVLEAENMFVFGRLSFKNVTEPCLYSSQGNE